MIDVLKVKNVVIFDFQEPYSLGLGGRGREGPQGRGRDHVASVHRQHGHGLLVLRHEGAERRRHRVLPDAEAGRRAGVRAAARASRARRPRSSAATARTASASSRRPARTSRLRARRSRASQPTRRSSPAGRRTTRASRSAPSARPPTAPCRSCSRRPRPPATRARARIAKRGARDRPDAQGHIDKGWILGGKFAWSKINTRDPNVRSSTSCRSSANGSYKLMN